MTQEESLQIFRHLKSTRMLWKFISELLSTYWVRSETGLSPRGLNRRTSLNLRHRESERCDVTKSKTSWDMWMKRRHLITLLQFCKTYYDAEDGLIKTALLWIVLLSTWVLSKMTCEWMWFVWNNYSVKLVLFWPHQAGRNISFSNATKSLFSLSLRSPELFTEAKSLLKHATGRVMAGPRPISTSSLAGKKRSEVCGNGGKQEDENRLERRVERCDSAGGENAAGKKWAG